MAVSAANAKNGAQRQKAAENPEAKGVTLRTRIPTQPRTTGDRRATWPPSPAANSTTEGGTPETARDYMSVVATNSERLDWTMITVAARVCKRDIVICKVDETGKWHVRARMPDRRRRDGRGPCADHIVLAPRAL